jgi:hypothetical protein
MIVLAAAMLMAGSAAAPAAPSQERRALGMCLAKVVHDKLMDKMDAAAFKTAAHSACAAQENAFRTAWVNYDVAMKTRRSEAEENANGQIEDYFANSTDSYVSATGPETPRPAAASAVVQASSTTGSAAKPAGAASPVTQASSTTPPKP